MKKETIQSLKKELESIKKRVEFLEMFKPQPCGLQHYPNYQPQPYQPYSPTQPPYYNNPTVTCQTQPQNNYPQIYN